MSRRAGSRITATSRGASSSSIRNCTRCCSPPSSSSPIRRPAGCTFLQQRVVAEAIAEARRKPNWIDSRARVAAVELRGASPSLAAFLAARRSDAASRRTPQGARRRPLPRTRRKASTVTPGDVALERGSGLVVLAKFHRDVPGEATLVIQPKNEPAQRIPLVKNLDDPVFGGGLPEVDARPHLPHRIRRQGDARLCGESLRASAARARRRHAALSRIHEAAGEDRCPTRAASARSKARSSTSRSSSTSR